MSQPPQAPPPPGDVPPPPGGAQTGSWDQPTGAPPAQPRSNGPAIAALVCGVTALLLSWVPFVNVLAILLGLVAVVTGIIGIQRAGRPGVGQKGMAIGGLITGVLGLLLALVFLLGMAVLFSQEEFREPFERLEQGEDPAEVFEDLQRELEGGPG